MCILLQAFLKTMNHTIEKERIPRVLNEAVVGLYTMKYKSNGILYVNISGERQETVEDQKEGVMMANALVGYKKVPVLYNHEEFALPNAEVRKYWAKADSGPFSLADAFILNSLAFRLIANFYMRVNKPQRPTQFFNSVADAEKWLLTFLWIICVVIRTFEMSRSSTWVFLPLFLNEKEANLRLLKRFSKIYFVVLETRTITNEIHQRNFN